MESNLLKNLLRKDIAVKSVMASYAYMACGLIVQFFTFNTTVHELVIKVTAVVVIICSIWRLTLAKKLRDKVVISSVEWNRLRVSIWLQSLSWSVIFTTISIESNFSGELFIVATTLMCGFTASSLGNLSTDKTLFIPLQWLMLGPPIAVMSFNLITAAPSPTHILLPTYVVYLGYQLYQHRVHSRAIISSLTNDFELKKTNEELKLNQILQADQTAKLIHTSRLAALGEMAAGIAHEVNNPLAIISGGMEQLDRLKIEDLNERSKLKNVTHKAQNSVNRISTIITGLRHFAQQSDHKPKRVVSVEKIISETMLFCSEMLKAHHVQLITSKVPEALVQCHQVQISQVLMNLLKNAEDAVVFNSDLKERWIKLSFEITSSLACIKLTNGGDKIAPEIVDKLFDPFFTTKGIGKGTGLGLSISRGIMREHGGDLILQKEGKNTTFIMVLPLYESPQMGLQELH